MALVKAVGILLPGRPGFGGEGKRCFDTSPCHVLTEPGSPVKLQTEVPWAPYGAFDISGSSPCLDCLSQFLCASCGKAEIINLCCAVRAT